MFHLDNAFREPLIIYICNNMDSIKLSIRNFLFLTLKSGGTLYWGMF